MCTLSLGWRRGIFRPRLQGPPGHTLKLSVNSPKPIPYIYMYIQYGAEMYAFPPPLSLRASHLERWMCILLRAKVSAAHGRGGRGGRGGRRRLP